MNQFFRNSWNAYWGFRGENLPVNPYDGGTAYNDPFPFTGNIDGGNAYSIFPVFDIDGGLA